MEDERLKLLLAGYHDFCINLIKKLPEEYISDDTFIQVAFRYRDELEKAILELQIRSKDGRVKIYFKEIEELKLLITQKEGKEMFDEEI